MFVLFTLIMLALNTGTGAENGEANKATLKILLTAFLYFLYIMITAGIFKTGLQPFFKGLIHYLLVGAPLALFMVYISNKQASNDSAFSPSTIVILMIVYTVIYVISAFVIYALGKKKDERGQSGELKYKSQFGKM